MINPENFLFFAKIDAVLWSIADFFLVFALIKFMNQIRINSGHKERKWPYYLLFATIPFALGVIFTKDLGAFIVLESFVFHPQYFIIIFLFVKEYNGYKSYFETI